MNKFTFTFVVGIDVSSKTSVVTILSPKGDIYGKKLTITNNLIGFKKLKNILDDISTTFSQKPNIFMESTGLYHILIYNYFSKCGFNCYVINPIKTKNFAKQSIRKVKTDKVDSLRIAQLAQSPTFVTESSYDENFFILKKLCREYSSLVNQRSDYKKKLTSSLNLVFPRFHELFSNIYSEIPMALLLKYSSYIEFLKAPKAEVIQTIISTVRHSYEWAENKYNQILEIAMEAKEMNITLTCLSIEIKTWINIINALSKACDELLLSIDNLHKQIPTLEKNVKLLCSHPEVGFISAISFLSEIGDITNFKNAKKVVAFVGLDSSVSQSGDFISTHNKLTKRGSNFARKVLFNLAIASIKTRRNGVAANPVLLAYYKKLTLRKPKKVAICAIMHKIINHFFAILRDQKPYELRLPETHNKIYNQNKLKPVI